MYNLLMTAGESDWDNPTWVLSKGRFLEHTHSAITEVFRTLSDQAVTELKGLPALFMYEDFFALQHVLAALPQSSEAIMT